MIRIAEDQVAPLAAITACHGSSGVSEEIEKSPVAVKAREDYAHRSLGMDHICLQRYDGTNFAQWHGRRSNGAFYPFGPIMEIDQ